MSSKLFVDPLAGNVGIGTTLPTQKLHIVGNMAVGTNAGYPNKLVPAVDGKINGVNVTALNARTRASQASAVAAVSTWTSRASVADNAWFSVTWSPQLSIFVAVAQSGIGNRVMTSPDGINWTARTSAADSGWLSVTWAPELSLFVAVAYTESNRVMTSPDGIIWTARTSAVNNVWHSVTWAPELSLFVAVSRTGTGDGIMTSPDGIIWTTRVPPADNDWRSVCWAPELSLFVAVSSSGYGNRVMSSFDGITWTARISAANNNWNSVTWAPELSIFVAVATSGDGNRVMTSPDGITWTARTSATNNSWFSVTWAPELSIFVAIATSGVGNRVMTSPDGIIWSARASAADNAWTSITWSPELSIFVAVSADGTGNRVMTSAIGMPNSKSVVKALPSQMTVLPNGNVGIGTTNPQGILSLGPNGAYFPAPSFNSPLYAIRAWCNFTMTTTPAIQRGQNISSVTYMSTGVYRCNFTASLPVASYALFFTHTDNGWGYASSSSNKTTTYAEVHANRDAGGNVGNTGWGNVAVIF